MGTGTGGYVWGRGYGKAPTWRESIPTLLLLPTLKWSGDEALSSEFPRPPEAAGSCMGTGWHSVLGTAGA